MSIDVNCTAWEGFKTGEWRHLVNVRNFIQKNYTPYEGDEGFLAPISERTGKVWDKASALIVEELKKELLMLRRRLYRESIILLRDILIKKMKLLSDCKPMHR